MAMIDIKNLTFGYDGVEAKLFENVNLIIDTEWKLGLVGRNGRGKTTFFDILRSKLHYSGQISGLVRFVSFPFDVPDENLSGEDVVRLVAPDAAAWQIKREMNLLDMDEGAMYLPWCLLSGGEKTKLQLIALFLDDGGFPLIDEPTNHLDRRGREVTAKYLAQHRGGFIIISHDRAFLDGATDHTMAINRSNIEISPVPFSTWWEQNELKLKSEAARNETLKKEINRLRKSEEAAQRWSDASERKKIGFDPTKTEKSISRRSYEGAKAAKMMKHAKNIQRRFENRIEEKASLLSNLERQENLRISGLEHHSDLLLKASNLVLKYDGIPLTAPISFELRRGMKMSLRGANGCGKTSLIRLISGRADPSMTYEGELFSASSLRISVVKQDTSSLTGTARDYAFELGIDETRFKSILNKLGFSRENMRSDMRNLSQGQKKCILLAGSLCQEAHLYIWDEPLNYVDIYIRRSIEELLSQADISMLFVEHDITFTDNIADSIIEISRA